MNPETKQCTPRKKQIFWDKKIIQALPSDKIRYTGTKQMYHR